MDQYPSRTIPSFTQSPVQLANCTAILSDLDGCLVSDGTLLPGARQFGETFGERLWIVSNNSTETPETLAARLAMLGLALPPERMILAGAETVRLAATFAPAVRHAIIADAPIVALARACGLLVRTEEPETVILCRHTGFDYNVLYRLLTWLDGGASLVVSNPDAFHPGAHGVPVPETGALLAAVLAVRPDQKYQVIGKPEPMLFRLALERAGVAAPDAAMIGDNPETDAAGALALGIPFVAVSPNAGVAHLLDLPQRHAPC